MSGCFTSLTTFWFPSALEMFIGLRPRTLVNLLVVRDYNPVHPSSLQCTSTSLVGDCIILYHISSMHCNDELSYILSYQSKSYPVKSYQIFSQVRQSTPSSLPVGVQVLAAANRTALAVAKVIMIQIMVMQFIRAKELVFYIFSHF